MELSRTLTNHGESGFSVTIQMLKVSGKTIVTNIGILPPALTAHNGVSQDHITVIALKSRPE
jgi:hypothetical protein